jgi:hypothetical protein
MNDHDNRQIPTGTPRTRHHDLGDLLPPELDSPIVVLVAGAWHAGWAWSRVAANLTACGWRSEVIELPSTAAVEMPRRGLHDDADVVRGRMNDIFNRYGGSAIVVAHSYAGAPVSEGLAGVHAVRHIVYLAAWQLDVGESALGVAGGSPAPWCHFDGDVARVADPHDVFFSDVPRRDAEWASRKLQPTSCAAFRESVIAAAWHTVPNTYVVCEYDRALPVELQNRLATRATRIERLRTGHSPFLSRPAELTQLIIDIAKNA